MHIAGEQTITVVGITGKARSGKDTAANLLVKHHGFQKLAFADALKRGCAAMLGLPLDRMYEGDREAPLPVYGFSIRHFLQKMGTECVRQQFGEDFWIKSLETALLEEYRRTKQMKFVIPDCRFDNEAQWVRSWGHPLVHVLSNRASGVPDHASEAGVTAASTDVVFLNHGTQTEFEEQIHDWAQATFK